MLRISGTLSHKGRGKSVSRREGPRIHLASQESLSFLLHGRLKPGHDGRVKSR
jgi:hypothetical protein